MNRNGIVFLLITNILCFTHFHRWAIFRVLELVLFYILFLTFVCWFVPVSNVFIHCLSCHSLIVLYFHSSFVSYLIIILLYHSFINIHFLHSLTLYSSLVHDYHSTSSVSLFYFFFTKSSCHLFCSSFYSIKCKIITHSWLSFTQPHHLLTHCSTWNCIK